MSNKQSQPSMKNIHRRVRAEWRETRKQISQKLAELRLARKLTHRELGMLAGRPVQASIRWCSGASCPEPMDLIPICQALKVSTSHFYGA